MNAPDIKVTTIHDHPFEPKGEWWSLCKHCGLGQASHVHTTPAGRPPWLPPVDDDKTAKGDDDREDDDLPIITNEDTMLDAQMHLEHKPKEQQ